MSKIFCNMVLVLFLAISLLSAEEIDYCEINSNTFNLSLWERCDGKKVELAGEISRFVEQHPTGLLDSLDKDTLELNTMYEISVDINNSQIVLSSKERIDCTDCISFEGIVDMVDLKGEEGTKGSYKNVRIKVLNYNCTECNSDE